MSHNTLWDLLAVLHNPRDGLGVLHAYHELMRTQWLDRIGIERLQLVKLRALAQHAVQNVPYYQSLSEFSDIACLDDFRALPILEKQAVRQAGKRLLAANMPARKLRASITGGTTGEPLSVVKSPETEVTGEGAYLRGKAWAGIQLGDRGIILKGSGRVSLPGRLREGLLNTIRVDAFQSGDHDLARLIRRIRRLRAYFVTGYATSFLRLADARGASSLNIPVILSTGEMLYEPQRQHLKQVFRAEVFDHYGSNEITSLAYECEFGTKHVVEEHVILETVDQDGNPIWDEPGRILVTDLDNYAMPFIRYEIGDVGILTREKCACGRQLRVLKSLEGRMQDALRTRDGKALPAIFFVSRFRELAALRAYQLAQVGWEEIELRYVPRNESAHSAVRAIRDEILRRLGNGMKITLVEQDQISLTTRGKSRLVIGLEGQ